jgi:hypothetical protein
VSWESGPAATNPVGGEASGSLSLAWFIQGPPSWPEMSTLTQAWLARSQPWLDPSSGRGTVSPCQVHQLPGHLWQ